MKGHIRQRGPRTWAIKVDVGKDPETGKRRTRWYTVKGTKRDAQRECNRILHELDTGQHVEPTRLTVAEYLERWLTDYAQRSVSAKTYERYAEICRKHLIPALGAHRLCDLKPLHIEAYCTRAEKEGRRPTARKPAANSGEGGTAAPAAEPRPLARQTVKHHYRVLHQALAKAVRWQLLPRNPADAVDPPRPERREMRTLDRDETNRLLEAAESRRIGTAVLLAVTTGMRRGEILALRWKDVDLDRGSLSVNQTLEHTKGGLNFKAPKTARSRRTITLGPSVVRALRSHKAAQARERIRLGPAYEDHGLVCAQEDGRPMAPNHVTKAFSLLVKSIGLKVRFHDLRHTHISHLLANGVHPKVAADRAGHASVAITLDTYSHVVPSLHEDAAAQLDTWLNEAKSD